MALTQRAKKRIGILIALSLVGVALIGVARGVQQSMKDARANAALVLGRVAFENADWEVALDNLSIYISRNQDDLESLIMFAEARRRVPAENSGHLASALKLFSRAVDLFKQDRDSDDLLLRALEGRSQIEAVFGQIARVTASSRAILEIDPENLMAIERLQAINSVTGDFLPNAGELSIRGDQSNEEWLGRLRSAEDESALRWVVERLVLTPGEIRPRLELLQTLRSGRATEEQVTRTGLVTETARDILEAWREEDPELATFYQVLIANELIRDSDPENARRIMGSISEKDLDSHELILMAIDMWEILGTPADRRMANTLLLHATDLTFKSPGNVLELTMRYWNSGRNAECFSLIEEAKNNFPDDVSLAANAASLAVLNRRPDSEMWVEELKAVSEGPAHAPAGRERIGEIVKILTAAISDKAVDDVLDPSGSEEMKREMIAGMVADSGRWISDPLVLCVIGDLASEIGFQSMAAKVYGDAIRATRAFSAPLNSRLMQAYWRDGRATEAFKIATDNAASSQTLASGLLLSRAWLQIESLGINASDVVSQFNQFDTPLELITALKMELDAQEQDTDPIQPLLVRALILNGDISDAKATLNNVLCKSPSKATASILVDVALMNGIEISNESIEAMQARSEDLGFQDLVTKVVAQRLRVQGEYAEVVRYLEARLADRTDAFADQAIGSAMLELARSLGGDTKDGFERLLRADERTSDLSKILRLAIEFDDREIAREVVIRTKRIFGSESWELALVTGRYVLAFEVDNKDSVMTAIRRIDPLVASGLAGPDYESVLARLLATSRSGNENMAIEVLLDSVARTPERLDNIFALVDLLQDAGRFEESQMFLSRVARRQESATPAQQSRLAFFLGRQGQIEEMVTVLCDLAERTGREEDILNCLQVRIRIGDIEGADALLDELAGRPTRSKGVEIELALRYGRAGVPELGVQHLRESLAFASEMARRIEIATILMNMAKWDEAQAELLASEIEAATSAKAQLLLAIIALRNSEQDTVASKAALDRAVSLEADNAGVLRQVARIAMGNEGLRPYAREYIAELGKVSPDQAELLRLALDAYDISGGEGDFAAMAERSQSIVKKMPSVPSAWELRLDILYSAFQHSKAVGNLDERDFYAERLEQAALDYSSRFPQNTRALTRLSQVHLGLGNIEEASLAGRGALVTAGSSPLIGHVIPLVNAEFLLGRFAETLGNLRSFLAEIEADPGTYPKAWEILFSSFLFEGQVENAEQLYRKKFPGTMSVNDWMGWLVAIENAPPAIAVQAARIMEADLSTKSEWFSIVTALAVVYRKTGDMVVKAEIDRLVTEMRDENGDERYRFRENANRVEILAISDAQSSLAMAIELVQELSDSLLIRLTGITDLEDEDERAVASAYYSSVGIFLNNFIARASEERLKEKSIDTELLGLAEACQKADDWLARLLPDHPGVLDSRAVYRLSMGDLDESRKMLQKALKARSGVSEFLFTEARILQAMGESSQAQEVARRALRRLRFVWPVNEELVKKINALIEEASTGKASRLEG